MLNQISSAEEFHPDSLDLQTLPPLYSHYKTSPGDYNKGSSIYGTAGYSSRKLWTDTRGALYLGGKLRYHADVLLQRTSLVIENVTT